MAIAGTIKMTAEQFLALGEDPPGVRLELVDGEIAVSPSPSMDHGHVVFVLMAIYGPHILMNDLGQLYSDIDTIFDRHEVRRPDLLFFRKDRLQLIHDKHGFNIPPDWAVEIISPGSGQMDRVNKFALYEIQRVPHYWLIDEAARTVEVFEIRDDKYRRIALGKKKEVLRLPPFPEVELPLGKLWRPKA